MATKKEIADQARSIFERQLEELKKMPDGPEKDAAIARLTKDYKGRTSDARSKRDNIRDDIKDAMAGIPTGAKSSAPGNPFSVSVADPFGAVAQGMIAKKRRDEEGEQDKVLEGLSQDQEAGMADIFKLATMADEGVGPEEAAMTADYAPAIASPAPMPGGATGGITEQPQMPAAAPPQAPVAAPGAAPVGADVLAAAEDNSPYKPSLGRQMQDKSREKFNANRSAEEELDELYRSMGLGR